MNRRPPEPANGVTWIELCAGTGAAAYRLVGGPHADAAVTYQGGKRRYATAILAALGLRPGQGAARVVLCDPGTWGRAWEALLDPCHVRGALATLRGWAAARHEGRALFEQIAKGEQDPDPGRWLAQFLALQDGAFGGKPVVALPSAEWKTAGYARSARQLEGESTNEPRHFKWRLNPAGLARRLSRAASVRWPARTEVLRRDAGGVSPDELRVGRGAFVFIDPPYMGTTGYGPTFTRPEVVRAARLFADAGAVVAVSEGEPVAELDGWHVLEISAAHHGQPRSFARSRREFLTTNVVPASRLPTQCELFGVAP